MTGLLATILADFRERTRRPSFAVTLAGMLLLASLLVPPVGASYATMTLDDTRARALCTSAHAGATTALLACLVITLVGFFLVFGTLERDRSTGVGQIVAATPLTRGAYVFGKLISNVLYLWTLAGILAFMAMVMQAMRGEAPFEAFAILAPHLALTIPASVAVAGLAVAAEAAGFRTGFALSVSYLVVWLGLVSAAATVFTSGRAPWLDLTGTGLLAEAARSALGARASSLRIGIVPTAPGAPTFVWPGLVLDQSVVARRVVWIAVGLGLGLLGTLFFDRFDSSRRALIRLGGRGSRPAGAEAAKVSRLESPSSPPAATKLSLSARMPAALHAPAWLSLGLLRLELRLALARHRWYAPASALLLVLGMVLPLESVRSVVAVGAALIVLPVLADLSVNEARYGIVDLLFATPRARSAYVWRKAVAGFALACLPAIGPVLRLGVADAAAGAWLLSGLAFTAAWAVAAGALSLDQRLFLVSMLLLWYVAGLIAPPPLLDYAGFHVTADGPRGAPLVRGVYPVFGLIALLLANVVIDRRASR